MTTPTTPAPLSQEEKRVKIAEALGLCTHPKEFHQRETVEDGNDVDTSYWCSKCGLDYLRYSIPDYFSDLNAMNEAEKVLTDEQFELYAFWLAHFTPLGKQICASAAQRAEAFGKTLGLW